MAITFTHPQYLFLLFVIPLIVLVHFMVLKSKRVPALRFVNFEAISRVRGVSLYSKNIFILTLTIIISALLIFSLSGLTISQLINSSSSSFVIAIDSSKSMEANDMLPDRMSNAKKTALNFVDSFPVGTRFSVVSFSGNSIIEQGITQDKSLIKEAIKNIEISSIGGTDLYEAIITSTNLLKSEDARAIILLSDGQINIGSLDGAINYANENDVIINSIAIGTEQGGITTYGLSKIDEDSLKAVAYNTEGKFFRAKNENEIASSFNEILDLKLKKVSLDLSRYLILIAFILFIIEYILVNTRYRIFP
jgi:Ca-activated chloride channel family protein|tara:strand:+ start:10914 stop:11834 length:921 start_codon:yes stop_codon:yes gene_type:complete